MSQKTVANMLETIAIRSSNPATSKQCWFLAGLISETDFNHMVCDFSRGLSKIEASKLIDAYLKNPADKKAKDAPDEPVEPKAKKSKGRREAMTW